LTFITYLAGVPEVMPIVLFAAIAPLVKIAQKMVEVAPSATHPRSLENRPEKVLRNIPHQDFQIDHLLFIEELVLHSPSNQILTITFNRPEYRPVRKHLISQSNQCQVE
jgi:hypothetical protein